MIEERRQHNEDRGDFLSTLLSAQDEEDTNTLSNQQARNEVLSLFVAGHETMATALTWCWYLLSQHSEIYERMRAEGDHVFVGRVPTVADLPNLPYTLQVFKETLRLYPPVYAFTRGAVTPIQLGAYSIANGRSFTKRRVERTEDATGCRLLRTSDQFPIHGQMNMTQTFHLTRAGVD